jgi:peptide/nickel transport system substrate-binding protein
MMSKKFSLAVAVLFIASLILSACATPTPEVIEKVVTKEVEKVVEKVVTQVVKETVKETVIVEGTPQVVEKEVTKIVEVEVAPAPAPSGGDLIIAMDGTSEPALLDGHIDPYTSTDWMNMFMTGDLLCLDVDLELKPYLAKDWEISDDGLTYTFYLRDDVTFSDGTPFNAEAVKYNIERILAPETASVLRAQDLEPLDTMEVVDDYTIVMHLKEVNVPFLNAVSGAPIWSPTAAEEYGLDEFADHLTGCGPYIFEENVPRDHVTVVRNPDFKWPSACDNHPAGQPANLDSVTWKWIGEEAVRGGIIRTGEVNVVQMPAQYAPDYSGDPDYRLIVGFNAGSGLGYTFNIEKPPFDDVRVRQAVLYAADRETINRKLYGGLYQPTYGPVNQTARCYWEGAKEMYAYDPEKAKALLEEAGWVDSDGDGIREKDGQPLAFSWAALHHEEIGEGLQGQMREVGIDLEVQMVAGPVQIDLVTNREFDLIYERLQSGTGEPSYLHSMYHSSNYGEGGWAWSGFKDEALDEVLDAAIVEPDPDQRCEYYVEAQKIIMENALRLPMLAQPRYWVIDDAVRDFRLVPGGAGFYPLLRMEQ